MFVIFLSFFWTGEIKSVIFAGKGTACFDEISSKSEVTISRCNYWSFHSNSFSKKEHFEVRVTVKCTKFFSRIPNVISIFGKIVVFESDKYTNQNILDQSIFSLLGLPKHLTIFVS